MGNLSPAARRKKGHDWERMVSRILRHSGFDADAQRNIETQPGSEGFDIKTRIPWTIQCKCLGRWSLSPSKVLEQSDEGTQKSYMLPGNNMSIGIVKINNKKPVVILYLEDFLEIASFWVKKYRPGKGNVVLTGKKLKEVVSKVLAGENAIQILNCATQQSENDPYEGRESSRAKPPLDRHL